MTYFLLISLASLLVFGAAFIAIASKKNILQWLPDYIRHRLSHSSQPVDKKHILFCFVDHYEPQWGKDIPLQQERDRVDRWMTDYPKAADKFKDSDGHPPKHSFFYPEEEYRFEHLEKIADLCQRGYGEIEIHLHHDNDTSDNLRQTLTGFTELLHKEHGAFVRNEQTQQLMYSFIHGNWTLNNCHPNGEWCGVNDELIVLKETGCFADFTFPSAPSNTQPATANRIYYAKDNPGQPNSHNTGRAVTAGGKPWGDLMLITGPLGLNWKARKKGIFPQIENSDIRASMPPTKDRIDLWAKSNIHVEGQPNWIFIKVHTHGTQEQDMDTLLGRPFEEMCEYLDEKYNDGIEYALHYVSAREMYNIAKAAEADKTGNPNEYRDFIVPAPSYHKRNQA